MSSEIMESVFLYLSKYNHEELLKKLTIYSCLYGRIKTVNIIIEGCDLLFIKFYFRLKACHMQSLHEMNFVIECKLKIVFKTLAQ